MDVPNNAIGFAARGVAGLQFISDLIDAGVIAGDQRAFPDALFLGSGGEGAVPIDIDDPHWRGFSRPQSPFRAAPVGAGN